MVWLTALLIILAFELMICELMLTVVTVVFEVIVVEFLPTILTSEVVA